MTQQGTPLVPRSLDPSLRHGKSMGLQFHHQSRAYHNLRLHSRPGRVSSDVARKLANACRTASQKWELGARDVGIHRVHQLRKSMEVIPVQVR